MDIDDILADIDTNAVPQETKDLQILTRAWVAERVAPELLPYPEELMERVLERIAKQVRTYSWKSVLGVERTKANGRGRSRL
jgi:GINS complex subunit 4